MENLILGLLVLEVPMEASEVTGNCYAMVITPHPDDAEFGIAGTVARWSGEGREVVYVVCTDGSKGSVDPEMTAQQLIAIREQEQLAAARLLGVKEVIFLRHSDQCLEDTPEFREQIVRLIRKYRPEIIATSDPYRRYIWHRDHRITGQVVLDAVFPYARDRLAYPDLIKSGLMPHKVREILLWGAEQPNYFSDVTSTFDTKMAALRCHSSQMNSHPTGWEEQIRRRHGDLAHERGLPLTEAFYRVEILW